MRGTERPLCEEFDVALLDLDGVVYRGAGAIPGAVEAVGKTRAAGMRTAFVTNNASRTPAAVAAQLAALGIPAAPGDVVTSAQAAARLLAAALSPGSPVLVVGGMGLRQALRERGLRPVSTAAERPAAVVQGYAPQVDYGMLAEGALAVRAGARYVAANLDATLPTARGDLPGNGALSQVIQLATGCPPTVAGKPEPPLFQEAIDRLAGRRPLVIGDRLDTDISGAIRVGVPSLAVLTGVAGPIDVVLAPADRRPSFLAADLGGVLVAHPRPEPAGDGWRCGGWTARVGTPGDRGSGRAGIELTGGGGAVDALRAMCAAAWRSDLPIDQDHVGALVATLFS